LQRVNVEFARYLKSRTQLPICDGMSLESFLLLPMRRLPRYIELLSSLMECTPRSHVDFRSIRKSLKKLRELLVIYQKNIFIINNKYKIIALQRKLKVSDLLIPNRFLLKEGKLVLMQSAGLNNLKEALIKQINNKNSFRDSVRELNPFFESFRAKITGSADDFAEYRVSEMEVDVYLFSDILLVRETNIIQKLVGRFYIYNLKGAIVSSNTTADNNTNSSTNKIVTNTASSSTSTEDAGREFSLLVSNSGGKGTTTRILTFRCENRKEQMAWIAAIQKTLNILNHVDENSDEELYIEENNVENEEDITLNYAYESFDQESVMSNVDSSANVKNTTETINTATMSNDSKVNTSTITSSSNIDVPTIRTHAVISSSGNLTATITSPKSSTSSATTTEPERMATTETASSSTNITSTSKASPLGNTLSNSTAGNSANKGGLS
jgi:hypothetical protein